MNTISLPYKITDSNYSRFTSSLKNEKGINGYLSRENYVFGYCPTFVNDDDENDRYYRMDDKWMTWDEVKNNLRATWMPVRSDEKEWFANNL